MGLIVLFVIIIWGWVEIMAFSLIGGEVGILLTILGVFVTAMVGVSLLKRQGQVVMNSLRTEVAQGRSPVKSVADSIGLLCGAVLMLLPGYVTDAVGLVLFLPGIRTIAGLWLAARLANNARFASYARARPAHNAAFGQAQRPSSFNPRSSFSRDKKPWDDGDIIEGEAEEKDGDSKLP